MSVVVRMEMPSGCDKCVFFFGNCILDEKDDRTGYVHFNEVVIADYKGKYAVRKDRPDWCPIICQLPEGHGRLIDWDAFERAGFKLCRKTSECRAELGTPTNEFYIVPAERSET